MKKVKEIPVLLRKHKGTGQIFMIFPADINENGVCPIAYQVVTKPSFDKGFVLYKDIISTTRPASEIDATCFLHYYKEYGKKEDGELVKVAKKRVFKKVKRQ